MNKYVLITVAACIVAAGVVACSKPASVAPVAGSQAPPTPSQKPEPLPVTDMRSPDTLVKSLWALQEWLPRNADVFAKGSSVSTDLQKFCASLRSLVAGDAVTSATEACDLASSMKAGIGKPKRHVITREIQEVKTESDTRAVVVARFTNKASIPSGLVLSGDHIEQHDVGREVRYIVDKLPEGWRIMRAY